MPKNALAWPSRITSTRNFSKAEGKTNISNDTSWRDFCYAEMTSAFDTSPFLPSPGENATVGLLRLIFDRHAV